MYIFLYFVDKTIQNVANLQTIINSVWTLVGPTKTAQAQ